MILVIEIEGMSLYTSALKYFNAKKIKSSEEDYYKNKKYITSTITSSNFQMYEDVQISYKAHDLKYILLDISGIVDFKYSKCLNEIKSIAEEFSIMFKNTKFEKILEYTHGSDESGESKISDMFWEFKNGDKILLACYYWDTKFGKENNYVDELRVTISSKEFDMFLVNDPY